MNKFLKIKFLYVSLASIFLVGCSDQKVEAVQNAYVDTSRSYTFGQALNNRDDCETIKWTNEKDDKKRDIVKYECFFKDSKDFMHFYRDQVLVLKKNILDDEIENLKNRIEENKEDLNQSKITDEELIDATNEKLENLRNDNGFLERETYYNNNINGFKRFQENYDPYQFSEFIQTNSIQLFILNNRYEFPYTLINSYEKVLANTLYMKKNLAAGEQKNYYDSNISENLDYLSSNIQVFIDFLGRKLDEEKQSYQISIANKIKYIERDLELYNKKNLTTHIESIIEDINNELNQKQSEYDQSYSDLVLESIQNFPIFEKGSEQYIWIVNKDLEPHYAGGGLFGYANGKANIFYAAGNTLTFFHHIHSESYKNMKDYLLRGNIIYNGIKLYD